MSIKFLLLSVLSFGALYGQATGVVTATNAAPPVPAVVGKVSASAGPVSCIMTGNAVPATSVIIGCSVNGVVIPAYTFPLAASQAYTFQHNFGVDAVTVIIQCDAAKQITVAATANNVTLPPVKF